VFEQVFSVMEQAGNAAVENRIEELENGGSQ